MELEDIKTVAGNADEFVKQVIEEKTAGSVTEYLKQYDPKQHTIFDTTTRPDKQITLESGGTKIEKVARLGVPFQKQIVSLAAAFLCGNPIELEGSPVDEAETKFIELIKKVWKLNKLNYDSKTIASLMMAETEAAELWYTEEAPEGYWKGTVNESGSVKFRLRMKILANSYGDELYPVFSNSGDMVAFGRAYKKTVANKEEEYFDIYTEDTIYKHLKAGSGWVQETEANQTKKIPVIYYSQPTPEWSDVQEMIDRFEKLISNHADTNDYFGSPIVFVEGELEGFADKGEQGKVIIGKNGARASYLTWDQSPESVKLELENLRSLILDMTNTPDISIQQMKSLGTYSGIALKMLFLSAHLKAANKEENFGKSIQRRINYLKAAMGVINTSQEKLSGMDIEPKFKYFLPENMQEVIDILNTATGGEATLSQETAISLNPFVKDPATELQKINDTKLNSANEPNL